MYSIDEIKTVKIISHDIIKSIDNLEYLESERLNEQSPEDELFFRYGKEIEIDDYENFIKSIDYKKATRYLKDNNINETLINRYILIIYDYLKSNNEINLETLKKAILNKENIKHSHINHSILIEREKPGKSGETFQINETEDINYNQLRCVIKMAEYTPISGGNIAEFKKIPDLFLNKRSLLLLRNNDNKCFLYFYIYCFIGSEMTCSHQ